MRPPNWHFSDSESIYSSLSHRFSAVTTKLLRDIQIEDTGGSKVKP